MSNQNKYAYFFIGLLSLAVLSFLTWLIYMREPVAGYPSWVTALPYSNAFLNSLTSALLIWGYVEIKTNRNESAHKKLMISATLTSGLFLVSYVLYHHFHGDTKFLGQGVIRPIYFFYSYLSYRTFSSSCTNGIRYVVARLQRTVAIS